MLDEEVANALRAQGHDAVRVCEIGLATADDQVILERAISDDRLLVTLDEHFGDWAVLPLSEHPGVVRVKAAPATTARILGVLVPFLEKAADRGFRDHLVIVRSTGVRWIRTGSLR
ncbi:MAG: hypothetical protein FJ280_11940 [Planctomycetes bacterium]|nr:hypothetical protein [Planctomycetota bacterium]